MVIERYDLVKHNCVSGSDSQVFSLLMVDQAIGA
jgi:hypothetical protein